MTIMITGATGQLGKLVIEQLSEQVPAAQIIAGVRHPDKAMQFKEKGIELRLVDYDRPETLQEAFAGVNKLLLISSSHTDDDVRLVQHKRVIDAAKAAGVAHILYTSFAFPQAGHKGTSSVHGQTEQAILDTRMDYTILRNGLYIDFVGVLGLNEAIRSGVLTTLPGDWQFNAVTRSDLARATAKVLAGSGHEHRTYELAAPQTWTFTELAEVLTELAGKPVVHTSDASVQHWIYHFLSSIDTKSTSNDLEQLMGQPVTPLKESIAPFLNLENV
ncbi:SDR family oxidoreductase [Paenibacillus jilunlii]|uniref:NAD(P)H dehydrogenase (Quinone) n=1 Tax=Paenibacillus jilunlii TaxID=682956 RepID=A0A1G9HLN6_9BACL|nr:SDR family oxidoreductase [Paenibacillus jilunlii]KWX69718.1 NmrA family transcriptional regulator [Paenibacillus jilunlii]SDL13792.1 NAD(P)H dehydrogenase (quinone) [Paenibacillus jilunlii]